METSPDGIEAIEDREGLRTTAYQDAAGLWTIGYGHLLTRDELHSGLLFYDGQSVPWRQGITIAQAQELLHHDLLAAETAVNTVTVPLSQNQFDSLVSFTFNVGTKAFTTSTLYKSLNAGQYTAVPIQLQLWDHVAGKVNAGLLGRRNQEIAQWQGNAEG